MHLAKRFLHLPTMLSSADELRLFIKYWLPVLLWMVFIFIGSTDLMSAEHTSRFIGPFLRWFAPDITDATIASIQLVVRKCAHLTEYAILSALLLRALRQHFIARRAPLPLSSPCFAPSWMNSTNRSSLPEPARRGTS